ncbi:membrane permeability protein SanA [Leptospira gomenensis]|uniref:Membrane permeability protein SanA n=1 Tax=Leptospira gomenensis TaxID=2484974 RepID=A0A5F1Y640_9LEPT|nr:membrane permeability protein SanA [Leptospira gomenensis]TGK36985.1 membrane permeability protein SanA [Leptospira gomenensis]TGK45621.1 membrane permeability protein SanA [Leptospira gomenensis]TGK59560.1 membrane permeability protein SanA [Leptospira gomenensis]
MLKLNFIKKSKVSPWLIFGLILFLAAPIAIDFGFEESYLKTDRYRNYRFAKPATVAVVPGASVYKNEPSPVLKDRLDCALELYHQGKVRKILLSGDNGSIYYNEVKPMLTYILKNGVNERDIFVDHAGFRTLDTLVRAKEIFRVRDMIFVSQRVYQPRAAFLAKKIGLQFQAFESDRRIYTSGPFSRSREFLARTLAWVDMNLFKTTPKYLGNPFPIEGSGIKTWKGSVL